MKELEMAKRVQDALLNMDTPHNPEITLAKRCIPATNLGGDFYTFVSKSNNALTHIQKTPGIIEYQDTQENSICIALGDVAGHGVSSALVMALSFGLFGKIAQQHSSPATILQKANNDIQRFIQNSQISHVTACISIINLTNKKLTYSHAGHHATLLVRPDESIEELQTSGLFLGMYENENYEEKTTQLQSGDRLLIYTDGIFEPTNKKGDHFGVEKIKKLVLKHKNKTIHSLLDIIYSEVDQFTHFTEAKDDRTMVIFELN